ncbi:hypothetical protein DAERI_010362 [Deinococcus aerius]|uniref:Uncharacterized protein n=1 Tax=Deinococcus aerius TaxID=200253 RepID=A0A2I9D288_9DEIO|nr:hypothetical protein [Deinococcus aerius]GBF04190.1 hypothetical protein DAERI_010362 [Deinococcus aerius]
MTDRNPLLIARLHLPSDASTAFVYRAFGDNVGAMDGEIFSFQRAGETIQAYAWWETVEPVTLVRGEVGTIAIHPMNPELWQHLKAGQTLNWAFTSWSAQILHPLS